jgi:uncharacterized protein (DUF433 family)
MNNEPVWKKIITKEQGKCGGKPCIRGLRIRVIDILGMLAAGMSREEILADFTNLTSDDITACIEYSIDKLEHLQEKAA